jgi:hypothetical protein
MLTRHLRHYKADGLAVDHPVGGVSEFDQHLVRVGFEADHDQGFAVGVDEVPAVVPLPSLLRPYISQQLPPVKTQMSL